MTSFRWVLAALLTAGTLISPFAAVAAFSGDNGSPTDGRLILAQSSDTEKPGRRDDRQENRGERRDDRGERRDDRQENRVERRDDRQENRGERQDDRQENRDDRQENRQERRQ